MSIGEEVMAFGGELFRGIQILREVWVEQLF